MRNSEAECHSFPESREQVHWGDDGNVSVVGDLAGMQTVAVVSTSARKLHSRFDLMAGAGVTHIGKVCGRVEA